MPYCYISECGKFPLSLPKLPDFAVGALKDSCTAIDCCVDVSWLRRTLQMGFNIDFCDFSISGNLEKLTFRINVIGFEYSKYIEDIYFLSAFSDVFDEIFLVFTQKR